MKAPDFWYRSSSVWGRILNPLGRLYAWSVARRFRRVRPYQADIPVICVGNISVGGTGKTPVCLALGEILKQADVHFFFLNHGYKARLKSVLVDTRQQTALDVGDEALLLAQAGPTVVDSHRARGAQIAVRAGARAVIMDDGFQNPSLIKTISFVVIDGRRGFGNGRVLPAGPLREPMEKGLARADAVIIVGEDTAGVRETVLAVAPDMVILTGRFEPDADVLSVIKGQSVMAFAGIGNPVKFFNMLEREGVIVAKRAAFPDHYFYTRFDIEQMIAEAGQMPLVTTTKDFVKVPRDLQKNVIVVPGRFVFDDTAAVSNILREVIS